MFVTGCHRSGTSLLCSLFSSILSYESTSDYLPPSIDNPAGFFEEKNIVELNDFLLNCHSSTWSTPPLHHLDFSSGPAFSFLFRKREDFRHFALTSLWIYKDPRFCLTYPAFMHLFLRKIPLSVIIRSPRDFVSSLHLRDGLPFDQCFLIWFIYYLVMMMKQ